MSKTRLVSTLVLLASLAVAAVTASGVSARPTAPQATVKLGFITKFPVDFFFVLQNAAKRWDAATPGAKAYSVWSDHMVVWSDHTVGPMTGE